MDSFDVGRLTDYDFECVIKDLFEDILEVPLEIYTPGVDGGVDLHHMTPESGENAIVIQCKHSKNSDSSTLISHLKKKELPKIRKLNPRRYILVTSTRLTKAAKGKILSALSPYILTTGDIYGIDQIVAELRRRPKIIENHLRLWLSSTAVLQSLMFKGTLTRSSTLLEDAKNALEIYVPNQSYQSALKILDERHTCLILGSPGTGKTTLAQVLAATHSAKDFTVYDISKDADEIDSLWDDTQAQFFYYDDFLGQTALGDKLNKNEDERLISILGRIARSSNKRIVMTTRGYILEQAKQRYEKIHRHNFDLASTTVEPESYTKSIKGKILYNLVYFSRLKLAERAVFAQAENLKKVIEHANFNPRLIQDSLQLYTNANSSHLDAVHQIIADLNDPESLWDHVVQNQLDHDCVDTLIVLFSLGFSVSFDDLEPAFEGYYNTRNKRYDYNALKRSLRILEKTMITVWVGDEEVDISFRHPSIIDYMAAYITRSKATIRDLLRSAEYFEQVHYLCVLANSPNGVLLKRTLQYLKADLFDAYNRTIRRDGSTRKYTLFGITKEINLTLRMAQLLRSAEQLGIRDLATIASKFLHEHTLKGLSSDDNTLIELLRAVWESSAQEIIEQKDRLLEELLEILRDITDWNSARRAQELCELLGVAIITDDIREEIDEELDRYAEQLFEEVAIVADSRHVADIYTAEEALAHAEKRSKYFRYIEDARRIIKSDEGEPIPGQRTLFDGHRSRTTHSRKRRDSDAEIRAMFQSFAAEE